MNDINIEAFSFVERLKERGNDFAKGFKPRNKNLKGDGVEPIAQLDNVQDLTWTDFNPIDGKPTSKYKSIGGKTVGLATDEFHDFLNLLSRVSEMPEVVGKCDFDFLITNAFDWIIDVFTNKKAEKELIQYLLDKIDENTAAYTFYYRIEGMSIESEFSIGNTLVMFIDDNFIEKLPKLSEEDSGSPDKTKEYYTDLKGINLRVIVNSTFDNSKNIALREAELAVDVLKCFLAGYSLHAYHAIPDLKHRNSNLRRHLYYAFESDNNPGTTQIQNIGGFIPLPIDNGFLENAEKRGLSTLSGFIAKHYNDELYYEIIGIIQRFAQIVSTYSNYEKITKIISLLEGAILQRSNGRSFGETKIKKGVLPKLTNTQLELFQDVIGKAYRIRDAFIHNCQEKPIEEETLWVSLEIVRIFLINVISLHQNGKREFEDIGIYFSE